MAAIKGDRTLARLADHFDIHPNQIAAWKAQLEGSASQVFGPGGGGMSAAGLEMRRALLEHGKPCRFKAAQAGEDDFLEACACAWTARRVLRREAHRFPDEPRTDPRGLRMEIWA